MLGSLIDKAYILFEKYRADFPLDVCTLECCMKVEDAERLASLPVRDIPLRLLMEYNDSAKPDKTAIEEIKHFLPRYLQLIAAFQPPSHSTELSLSRLIPFDNTEWTQEELSLLREFSLLFFKQCLSVYPLPATNANIDAIIIMFSKASFDVRELLAMWQTENTKEAILHFRDLYFEGFKKHDHTRLSNAFGERDLAAILREWMNAENVKKNISKTLELIIVGESELGEDEQDDLNILYEIYRQE